MRSIGTFLAGGGLIATVAGFDRQAPTTALIGFVVCIVGVVISRWPHSRSSNKK